MAAGVVDPHRPAALNARYEPRFAALWSAAQAAAGQARDGAAARMPSLVEAPPGDRRFAAREWTDLPWFALLKQSHLLAGEYAHELAALVPLADADRKRLLFLTRQGVDALAPTNFPATNPEAIRRALETAGKSVTRGLANLAADIGKGRVSMTDERAFAIGRNLALTPGDVVFRNELIELIQYRATTATVHCRPLVMVPPCINKYYILDLQPENSFVRQAVARGHTVFIISWRNTPPELGALRWDDYLKDGVLAAIEAAKEITGSASVNVLGFCVGGTLLACALAVLAARRDRSVGSATLLATLLDFAEPGEIGVYISREMLAAREPALTAGERVKGGDIAGALASLRPNSLIWNYVVGNYLKDETPPPFDLLYWNGDSSNLEGPMVVHYLRNLYLDNRLREPGALTMAGERIDLSGIDLPSYVLATHDDHIVPWQRLQDHRVARPPPGLRPRRLRAHRRRDQSAGERPAQFLGQRRGRGRCGRVAGQRNVAPGQLVAALGGVARAARRRAQAGAGYERERGTFAARPGARRLCARSHRLSRARRHRGTLIQPVTPSRRRRSPRDACPCLRELR